ncbi:MAG: S-type pyocin family protein [Caulobacteraceae bacterium]|nr:S-type pyocin family protein [Caulobacteraceae bacterium]
MKTETRIAALAALLALGACGNGDSAVETRDRPQATPISLMAATPVEAPAGSVETATKAPGPVTSNRRETVDEKIQRLYERNGADFGARSPEEFLARITAFTTSPPAGTDRATRPNGDVLLYHASTNTFAVVDRAGTPRTMFKPDEGEAYWAEQKAAAPTFGQRRASN